MNTKQQVNQGFVVGGHYRNRTGEYKVLQISRDRMRVEYEDGTRQVLTISVQAQIIRNMTAGTSRPTPSRSVNSPNRSRRFFTSRYDYRIIGFLAYRITMMEAIVPPKSQSGFIETYREIVGAPPRDGADGYYVHREGVDKWGNELRITFDASESELVGLRFEPKINVVRDPGSSGLSWRINNNTLWWDLLRFGFGMGTKQNIDNIRERIPDRFKGDFDQGITLGQNIRIQ